MLQVSLHVELRLLPVGRGRQCHHPEHTRADAFGQRPDQATFAGRVSALEDEHDPLAGVFDPFLNGAELLLQLPELPDILLTRQFVLGRVFPDLLARVPVWCPPPASVQSNQVEPRGALREIQDKSGPRGVYVRVKSVYVETAPKAKRR